MHETQAQKRQNYQDFDLNDETDLKITTDENAQCGYSSDDCNFEVESGIEMTSLDGKIHLAEWTLNKNYYVRCKDDYGNQPFPNTCSIVVRPSEIKDPETTLEFGFQNQ